MPLVSGGGVTRPISGLAFASACRTRECFLGLRPAFLGRLDAQLGDLGLGTIELAVLALEAGMIDYALCICGEASPLWAAVSSGNRQQSAAEATATGAP